MILLLVNGEGEYADISWRIAGVVETWIPPDRWVTTSVKQSSFGLVIFKQSSY